MGRPPSQTVPYFTHDCGTWAKKTISTLMAKYKNDGYAFFWKMLEMLGSSEGHSIACHESDTWEFFVTKMQCKEDKCNAILQTLVILKFIDKELWESQRIIWCQGFVNRLKPVYDKRHQELPVKPILATGCDGNSTERDEKGGYGNSKPPSKVKYSKVPRVEKEKNSKDGCGEKGSGGPEDTRMSLSQSEKYLNDFFPNTKTPDGSWNFEKLEKLAEREDTPIGAISAKTILESLKGE